MTSAKVPLTELKNRTGFKGRIIRVVLICDHIWENLPCSEFYEGSVSCIFDKLYSRANLPPSLRPIAHFALELERFVYDRATPTINEKLGSKGVAMYAYSTSVYYV